MKKQIQEYFNHINTIWFRNAKTYKWSLDLFDERLTKEYWRELKVEELKLHHIMDYMQYFKTKKVIRWHRLWQQPAESYVKCTIKIIKQFVKFLKISEYQVMPREQIPNIKIKEKRFDMVSDRIYKEIRNVPGVLERESIIAKRNQLIIDILHDTWLRRAEVLRLNFSDFKTKNRQFEVLIKGGRLGVCFYSEKLRKKVLEYEKSQLFYCKRKKIKPEDDLIFLSFGNKNAWRQLNYAYISFMFNHYSEFLKASWKIDIEDRVHAHQFRHAFATRCVTSWLSQQATCALMRHIDPATTLRYYHLDDSYLRGQYDMIKL